MSCISIYVYISTNILSVSFFYIQNVIKYLKYLKY
uniref:Uncharacterized protein n=1 Tax=viral metagenome TaxID=1070528 RepID=A0A6C0CCQ2_9ZZZZ